MPNQRRFHPSLSKRPFIRDPDVIRRVHPSYKRARVLVVVIIIITNLTLSNLCDAFEHVRRGSTGRDAHAFSTVTADRVEDPL